MPKAILELPEMPRSCQKCPLTYYLDYSERNYPWEDCACIITGKGIADKGRRSDCPLKLVDTDMLEKQKPKKVIETPDKHKYG
jgi:hypothetical protein